MPIFTTYLGFLNRHGGADKVAEKIGHCFVYYVARDRGNNAVAPMDSLFIKLTREKEWSAYERYYNALVLKQSEAMKWMEKRAQEAKTGNILLVCFEKDATHCHRRLLAVEIARRFGIEYKGELEEPVRIYSLDGKNDKFNYES